MSRSPPPPHQQQQHHVNDASYYYGPVASSATPPPVGDGYNNPYIAGRATPPPLGAPPTSFAGAPSGYQPSYYYPPPAQQQQPYYPPPQGGGSFAAAPAPQPAAYYPAAASASFASIVPPPQQPYYPPPPAPTNTYSVAPSSAPAPDATYSSPSSTLTTGKLQPRARRERFNATKYLLDRGYTEAQLNEAKGEHRQESIAFFADPEEVIEKAGLASYVFFMFVKFVLVIFFVLLLLEVIIFSVYVSQSKPTFKANSTLNSTWYSDFFVSGMQQEQFRLWQALNALGLVLILLAGPLYFFFLRRIFANDAESTAKFDQLVDDTIVRYDNATGGIDVSARYRGYGEIVLRRLVSLLVFLGFVLIQVLVSLFLTQVDKFGSHQPGTVSAGIAFAVAFVTAILNFTFAQVSELTTEFEKHTRLGNAVRYTTLKRIAFMIANLLAVYWAKEYNEQSKTRCVYDIIGEQMAIQLIVEIGVIPFVQIAATVVFNKNYQWVAAMTGDIGGDNDELPKFDITNVYIRVLYKIYLAVMAMCVFPLSAVLSFVGLVVDMWVFKLMLFKLCGKPKTMRPMQRSVAFAISLCAVVAIITPFAGAGFVLSGETGRLATKNSCRFPPST